MENPIQLDSNGIFLTAFIYVLVICIHIGQTYWVDVCPRDGNLLASGGTDNLIKVFDKRQSKIAKTIGDINSCNVN